MAMANFRDVCVADRRSAEIACSFIGIYIYTHTHTPATHTNGIDVKLLNDLKAIYIDILPAAGAAQKRKMQQ